MRPKPVILNGPSGWDNYNLETPFPFVFNDTLYVFYSAYGDRNGSLNRARYQISFASIALGKRSIKEVLFDGGATLRKYKDGLEPLMPGNYKTSDFDNNAQEPSVVVTKTGFEVYFTGIKLKFPDKEISTDDTNRFEGLALIRQKFNFDWSKSEPMEVSNTTSGLDPNKEEFALAPINIAEVKYLKNKYHIFYTTLENGSDFHKGERIAHAVSDDGLNWKDPKIVLNPGTNSSDFDSWGIMAPTIAFDAEKLLLFYTAWGPQRSGKCVLAGSQSKWGQSLTSSPT